jgi:ABC-type nitrate/sulfonate/bicarbonate transport system substrate-binding protein
MQRLRHLRPGALAALVSFLIAAPAGAAEPTLLAINAFPNAKALPLHVGVAKGIFEKRGLKVDLSLTDSSQNQRNGLAAGKYQIVHSAVDNAIAMIEGAKQDVVIVSGGDSGMNEFIVQAGINSFRDLRGKTIVVDAPDTAYALQAKKILLKNGLKEGDYTIKPVGAVPFRLKAMLESKDNAASILNLPYNLQAEEKGMKSLGSLNDLFGPYQAAGAFTMRSWAEKNRDVLERYLAAYVEAVRFVRDPAQRAANVGLLMAKLNLSQDTASRTLDLLVNPGFGFTPDAKFDQEGFRSLMAVRAEIEGGKSGAAPSSGDRYVDLSYYDDAMKLSAK